MDQVAELSAAERIVTEVLDDRAPVRVSMGLADLVFGDRGKPLQQERADIGGPYQVDDLFVSKHRMCRCAGAEEEREQQDHGGANKKQAPPLKDGASCMDLPHR